MTRVSFWALIALFVINLYGGLVKGWGEITLVSMAFHLLGGFFAAMLVFSFYHSEFERLPQHLRIFVIVALTMAIGVTWEFAEYIGSKTLTQPIYDTFNYRLYFMGDLDDTIQDLAMDLIGTFVFLALLGLGRKSCLYFPGRSNPKQ